MDSKVIAAVVVGFLLLICWRAWRGRSRAPKPRVELLSPLLVPPAINSDAGASANGSAPAAVQSAAGPQHRLDAASRDAGDGFNQCAFCGFENFRRFRFCNLCGTELLVSQGTFGAAFVPGIAPPHATERQKRARSRKAWTRRLTAENKLIWFHDPALLASNRQSQGYALRFHLDDATPTPEELMANNNNRSSFIGNLRRNNNATTVKVEIEVIPQENIVGQVVIEISETGGIKALTKEAVLQSLEVEAAFQSLLLAEASVADATLMPIHLQTEDKLQNLDWGAALSFATRDFPTKYSYFVKSMAELHVKATKQYVKLNIRRDSALRDSMEAMAIIPRTSVHSALRIDFLVERGVDAGGLQREWLMLLNLALAEPANGVFKCIDMAEQIFYLNPNSARDIGDDHLMYYFGTGRLIGRALSEGQVLNFHLALPLLKIILGMPLSFLDLEYFDKEAFKSLQWITDNHGVDDLGITFSVAEKVGDEMIVVDLIENGREIDVTDENKDLYIERKFRYLLFESVSSQLFAFLKGLYEVIPQELLVLFDPEELDYVLCGSDDIDVVDWEKNTVVSASLQTQGQALKWFWEFVHEMPNEYRRRLLHFATGSSRVPLGGFGSLTSIDGRLCKFTLKGVKLEESEYIASHACFNQLEIPMYESRAKMETVLFATLELDLHGFTTD